MKSKISIIGAGQVGGTTAHILAQKALGDVVLLDVVEGSPQGKALDIMQSCAVTGLKTSILGTNNYKDIAGSDIVFITAGFPRKPGMDRLDLLRKNAEIIKHAIENVIFFSPKCILIIMTNPVDVLTYYALKTSGFGVNRVIGQAGVLDTARFIYFIAQETKASPNDIKTIVLGGHGDTMVPLPRLTTVKGKRLADVLPEEKINYIIDKTRNGGAEIVNLLKTGSAFYAPAASAVAMIEAIITDSKEILPASVCINGEYGVSGICIGVPVVFGKNGAEKVVDINLNEEELKQLHKSAEIYRESIKDLNLQ